MSEHTTRANLHEAGILAVSVAMCICTRKRPQMLKRCLQAASQLKVTEAIRVTVVVVENDDAPYNRSLVSEFGCIYVHEPLPGLVRARSAAVRAALDLQADFVAFTDDDAWVEPDWILSLLAAQKASGATVVRGFTLYVYPDKLPRWVPKRPLLTESPKLHYEVNPLHVGTNNCMIAAAVFRPDGMNLSFDMRFNFRRGEDSQLCSAIKKKGGLLVATDFAIVREEIVPERATFFYQVRRSYQSGQGDTTIYRDDNHPVKVAVGALWHFLIGLWIFVRGVPAGLLLFNRRRLKSHMLKAGKKIAYAAGRFSALFGSGYEHYHSVEGY